MSAARPRILYVTDLAYPARGRRYCDEDILLTSRLRAHFTLALCHPQDARALMDDHDAVVIRNSGPVLHYQTAYDSFRAHALATRARVYNPVTGKGDMAGKQYLLDLTTAGHPVIPTVDGLADLARLPASESYAVKPKQGADSIGLEFVPPARLPTLDLTDVLIQPKIDFVHEISFYFVDHAFQYALYAPDPSRRWDLIPYPATEADLEFAHRFITWNALPHGIQRVDACRTPDGALLLVELEDLNPYLSLDALDAPTRESFISAFTASLRAFTTAP
ncbi:hypothetical protein EDD29_5844 [Actinocorallia herbida]|uniref:ATP-grasp domain-containing protein n=1 Tax=Actinocorallia herbida TaxID=58109 RepID=A0A3N1D3S5_9ACTN|nr:hypothetical protein [Actinocorallia herbida]ROO88182.1 hypothetical protein EDD29_5844 [Actinocorallia herbida]